MASQALGGITIVRLGTWVQRLLVYKYACSKRPVHAGCGRQAEAGAELWELPTGGGRAGLEGKHGPPQREVSSAHGSGPAPLQYSAKCVGHVCGLIHELPCFLTQLRAF